MVTGVSGGMAEYLDIDPVLVRAGWVLICIFSGGLATLAYIVLTFIMPERPLETRSASPANSDGDIAGGDCDAAEGDSAEPTASGAVSTSVHAKRRGMFGVAVGFLLIVIGGIFLGVNFGVFSWWDWGRFWPIVLIVLGLLFIVGRIGGRDRDG